jgi:hypothetical protein
VLSLCFSGYAKEQEEKNALAVEVYSGPCIVPETPPDTPRFEVNGRVVNDVTGAPIAGATVKLNSQCFSKEPTRETTTDDQGRFTFQQVPAMGAEITATFGDAMPAWNARRRANDPLNNYVIGPHTGVITLRLALAASISGVVRGADGSPLSPAWVTLWCFNPWGGWPQERYCNS